MQERTIAVATPDAIGSSYVVRPAESFRRTSPRHLIHHGGMAKLVCTFAAWAGGAAAHAQYQPGFQWNRDADWTGGSRQGGSWRCGNPDDDQRGTDTWSYEISTGGGAFDSATPWYRQPTILASWDATWFGTGEAVWAYGDDIGPPLHRSSLVHDRGVSGLFGRQPLVRWTNPSTNTIAVRIGGSFRVRWSGSGNLGCPVVVDVVLARIGRDGRVTDLIATSVAKPIPTCTIGDFVDIPVAFDNLGIGPHDQLVWSLRAREAGEARWIILEDTVEITLLESDACQVDFNGDGFVDFFDYAEFVAAFEAGC